MSKPLLPSLGAIELRAWFARTSRNLTDPEVAARCGCSASHLANVACGRFTPSRRLAIAIERETGVRVRAWDEYAANDNAPKSEDGAA